MKLFLNLLFVLLLTLNNSSAQEDFDENLNQIYYIKILKSKRKLSTFNYQGKLIKDYKVALGKNPRGKKQIEGDNKTPEGIYEIEAKNPNSAYFLSLKISYPSEKDKITANKLSLNPGSDIMIHGLKNGFGFIGKYHANVDWTQGCIALTNEEIQEIFDNTEIGAKVEILP